MRQVIQGYEQEQAVLAKIDNLEHRYEETKIFSKPQSGRDLVQFL